MRLRKRIDAQNLLAALLQQPRHLGSLLLQLRDGRASAALAASRVAASVTTFISRSTSGRCCWPHSASALRTKCTWQRCHTAPWKCRSMALTMP